MRGKVLSLVILVLLLGQSVSAQVDYNVVDDFDSYASTEELRFVWDDHWVNGLDGFIYLETDPNYVRDGNSVRFEYHNIHILGGKYIGSQMDAQDPAELEVGADWTVGGVKSLSLYFFGDPCNTIDAKYVSSDRLWVELREVGTDVGLVKHTDVNQMAEAIWHEWNIALKTFSDAGVDLSNLDRVTIGIGGAKVGQLGKATTQDQIWIDDIRLYPPRCLPELGLSSIADISDDCIVDYCDIDIMATDWLLTDGYFPTENRPAVLTGFPDANSHWTTDCAVGTGAIEVNEGYNITVTDPRLYGIASMSITAWIKQTIDNEWGGIVSSRENPCPGSGEATELFHAGAAYSGYDGLGYDWSCLPGAWQHDFGLDVPTDGTWTFCALVVDPNGASAYMRPAGSALQTGVRNVLGHPVQQCFAQSFMIGRTREDAGYFKGAIDDVRIYDYNLSFTDVCDLAYQTADPNTWPVYHYKFDETSGYTAADSGHPTLVYGPVPSVANLTDQEPKLQRAVNFVDYEILANDWLAEFLWPPE